MTFTSLLPDVAQRFAGALLQFIWQGAVIALFTAIVLKMLRRHSPEARYAVGVAGLSLMLVAPVVTFVFYERAGPIALMFLRASRLFAGSMVSSALASDVTAWTQGILAVWSAGVLAFLSRLVTGWYFSRRLVSSALGVVPAAVQQAFDALKERLVLTRVIRLLVHARIESPIVVGWLRPVVLLPISVLTSLPQEQLLAVLAHELAHIRRHDFLVNILQRCVESILFYHPGVWWLSNRIRIERENCCDDLAVRMCGDRKLYAEALLRLERERVAGSALAVAATGTGTIKRIQRILGLESSGADWQAAVVALVFVVVWISAGLLQPATLDAREIAIAPPRAPEPIARVVAPAASSPLEAIAAIITAQQAPTAPAASVSVESQAPSPQFLPLGVIEGQLRHINGNPAAGIRVAFMPLDPGLGASALAKTVLTDRNGRYRLPDVEPGRYWIAAGLSELRTYYPGVTVESDPNISIDRLQFVTVASGQTVSNIDFTVAPVSLATKPPNGPAAGIMMMDDGSPLPAIRLGQRFGGPDGELLKDASESYLALLLEVNGQPVGLSQPEALRGANIASISYWIRGVFQKRENVVTIPQLPSGYYVKSMTYGDVDLTKAPLIVRNSDVIEIVLTKTRPASLPPGVRLSGRITDRSFGSKTDLRLVLTPVTNVSPAPIGQAPVTTVLANSDDGSFEINGVLPGRYTLAPFGYRQNQMAAPLDVRLLQLAPVLPGVTFEVGAVDVTNLELKFEP